MHIEAPTVVNLLENIAGFEVPPELLGRDPIVDDVVAPPFDVTPYLAAAHYGEQLSLLALLRQRPVERMRSVSDVISADLFAGGGGASLGIELATGSSPIVAINHDEHAIEMHTANHPLSIHYHKDVWDVSPWSAVNGAVIDLLWASPDCTHFSRARGGKPVKKEIRGLAWIMVEWAATVKPSVIAGENVKEILTWGPLWPEDHPVKKLRNKPMKERSGETWDAFKLAMGSGCPDTHPSWDEIPERCREFARRGCGYNLEHEEINAADHGTPTSRKRLYFIARRDGEEIRWPAPTHGPGRAQPWRTAAECLDFDEPSLSIFATPVEAKAWAKEQRKLGHKLNAPQRPLAMPTERRIAEGIRRFVLNAADPFIITTGQQSSDGGKVKRIGAPLSTIVTKAEHCLVMPVVERLAPVLTKFYGTSKVGASVERPMPTSTAQAGGGHLGLVEPVLAPVMLRTDNTSDGRLRGIGDPEEPLRTITSAGGHAVAEAVLVCTTHQDADDKPVSGCRVGDVQGLVPTVTAAHRGEWAVAEVDLEPAEGTIGETLAPLILRAHGKGWDKPGKASGVTKGDTGFPTITATEEWAVAMPVLVQTGYGERKEKDGKRRVRKAQKPRVLDLNKPLGTMVAGGCKHALVSAFLTQHNGGAVGHQSYGKPLNQPLQTVAGNINKSLDEAELSEPFAGSASANETPDRGELVVGFLTLYYGEGGQWQPLDRPLQTVVSKARFGLVEVVLKRWVVGGQTVFLGAEIDGTTYAAVVLNGELWLIVDIRMRMLTPRELARAQGFPDGYKLTGTKAQQIARIGNSVCPPVARAIVEANFGPRRDFQAAA